MNRTKILIIGGVAGGATAAARARRVDENAQIILFEKGEYISFANCGLPYYLGGVIKDRNDLLVIEAKAFADRYKIDVRIFNEAVSIDRQKKRISVRDIFKNRSYFESYDKLILSPGADPIKLPFEGINSDRIFNLRNIPDSDRIKTYVDSQRPKSAVIVGGGFIGLEMAENLSRKGIKTIIIEMLNQVMAPLDFEMASMVQNHLNEKGVICKLGNGVSSFSEKNGRLVITLENGDSIESDLVILSAGIRPKNRLAFEAGLEIGERGGIRVNSAMQTSDPDIFAVGDAIEITDMVTGLPTMTALAGPANKQARIAADSALGRNSIFKGTIGTAIVKIFDLTVASTGASEKMLKRHEVPYMVSYTHNGSHASYYPDATTMAIKLIFSPEQGKILGSQIVGVDGVDKRIDVLATALYASMTVFDLEELELAYAPPYSSAKDPINIAGFVAANMLKGDVNTINWEDIDALKEGNEVLIDLRNKEELDEIGIIEGSIHLPLDELRDRLDELDKDRHYIVYCAVGMRGYLAHRILLQNGFNSKNLSGGIRTYLGSKQNL
ncbi:FAD-dependent oxidoreductase [Thermodesulfobacteriota bacterium]